MNALAQLKPIWSDTALDFITGGDGDPGSVRDQLRDLEARKREIERDLRANLADLYHRKVGALRDLLADETARGQAIEIIRSLIERIEVYPGEARGQCDVTLLGALAQILAFTQHKNTAASGGDGGTFLDGCGGRI